MTLTVLRPSADGGTSNVTRSTGTVSWSLLDDEPADDATYSYVAAGIQYPAAWLIMNLPDTITLSASQRILRCRARARIRVHAPNNSSIATLVFDFRSPVDGSRTSQQSWSTASQSVIPVESGWYKAPPPVYGTEWTKKAIDGSQIDLRWLYSWNGHVNIRITEIYVDVDIRDQPVVSGVTITGAGTSTSPTVSWTYTPNADSDKQKSYRVKMFSAAQYGAANFDPETSAATWDSGVRNGDATQIDVGTPLASGTTYKAYVKASQDFNGGSWFSAWALSSATAVNPTALPAPTLTVTPDPTTPWWRNKLTVVQNLNRMSDDESSFETTIGSWVALANVTVIRSTTFAAYGVASLRMTATAGADMTARTASGTSGLRVKTGVAYTFLASFRSAVTARSCNVGVAWYDRAGTIIGSIVYGSNITDGTGGFTQATLVSSAAPTGAVFAAVVVKVQAAAAAEVHYVDKVSMTTGSSTVWSPGGFQVGVGTQTASTIIEWAWPTISPRNLAPLQLWSGGDVYGNRNADGLFVTGAASLVNYDMAETHYGEGSIRWGCNDAASKLYFGWPSTVSADQEFEHAVTGVPGRTYTFGVWAKASQTFSSQLNLQAIDRDGNTVGSPTNSGGISVTTSWQLFSATITVPAGACFVRPHLDNTASVTERMVWVDHCQWLLGSTADTDVRPAGGVAPVWQPVRGADVGELSAPTDPGDQVAYLFDNEVPPGYTVMYRAYNNAPGTDALPTLGSAKTAVVTTMMTPPGPGIWVLRDPLAATNAIRVHVVGASFSVDEDATAFHPLRSTVSQRFGQRPVVQSDYIGGADSTCEMWTDSEAEWYLLRQLLQTPRTLWLIRPDFGALWVRFMARSWPEESQRTGTGEDSIWRRKVTVAYLEVDRPT